MATAGQSYPREILQLRMFYNISKQEAEFLIRRYNYGEGTYVIRPNKDQDASFVSISLSGPDNEVFRVRVFFERDPNGGYVYNISPSFRFNTFSQLLEHYGQNQILVRQNINNLYLLHPVVIPPKQLQIFLSELHGEIASFYPAPRGSLDYQQDNGYAPATATHPISVGLAGSSQTMPRLTSDAQRVEDNKTKQGKMKVTFPASTIATSINSPAAYTTVLPSEDLATAAETKKPVIFSKLRSKSESQVQGLDKLNLSSHQRRNTVCHKGDSLTGTDLEAIRSRPPLPLPRTSMVSDDDIPVEYSVVEVNKKYFDELYGRLKEEEMCECGLRLEDAELADGWVVHRSNDEPTNGMIFYQNGEETTWNFPEEILPKINKQQAHFIFYLSQQAKCPPPHQLLSLLYGSAEQDRLSQETKVQHVHAMPDILHDGNLSSLSSTTSSSSSTSHPSLSSSSSSRIDLKLSQEKHDGAISSHLQQFPSAKLLQQQWQHRSQEQYHHRPRLKRQSKMTSQSSSSSSSPTFQCETTPYEDPASLFGSLTISSDSASSPSGEQVPIVGTYKISAFGEMELQTYGLGSQRRVSTVSSPTSPLTPTNIILDQPVPFQQSHPPIYRGGGGVGGTGGIASDSGGSRDSGHGGYSGDSSGESQQAVLRRRQGRIPGQDVMQQHLIQQQLMLQQHQESSHYMSYDPRSSMSSSGSSVDLPQTFAGLQHQQSLQQPHQPHQRLSLQHPSPSVMQQARTMPLSQISNQEYEHFRRRQLLNSNSQNFQQPHITGIPLQPIPQQQYEEVHENPQHSPQPQLQSQQYLGRTVFLEQGPQIEQHLDQNPQHQEINPQHHLTPSSPQAIGTPSASSPTTVTVLPIASTTSS